VKVQQYPGICVDFKTLWRYLLCSIQFEA